MNRIRIFAALLSLSLAVGPTRADETNPAATAPPAAPEEKSLQAYGASAPHCIEWSDGCAVCARGSDGVAHCSTPGVACQPGAVICSNESGK
jgi:hypothetical protein